MTSTNLNIILTNAVCCSSEQAVKVSKLLTSGSLCAKAEVIKLKLLNDYIEVLKCYNVDSENNCLSEEDFDIIVNNLMRVCDICHCQLIEE